MTTQWRCYAHDTENVRCLHCIASVSLKHVDEKSLSNLHSKVWIMQCFIYFGRSVTLCNVLINLCNHCETTKDVILLNFTRQSTSLRYKWRAMAITNVCWCDAKWNGSNITWYKTFIVGRYFLNSSATIHNNVLNTQTWIWLQPFCRRHFKKPFCQSNERCSVVLFLKKNSALFFAEAWEFRKDLMHYVIW